MVLVGQVATPEKQPITGNLVQSLNRSLQCEFGVVADLEVDARHHFNKHLLR
jgi:hypothetical protein